MNTKAVVVEIPKEWNKKNSIKRFLHKRFRSRAILVMKFKFASGFIQTFLYRIHINLELVPTFWRWELLP